MNSIIIANWKMYLTIQQSRELAAEYAKAMAEKDIENRIILCPSFCALQDVAHQLYSSDIAMGAQTAPFSADLGAFSGQQSLQQLTELGCEYVIIGHSEMRQYMHISDKDVSRKLDHVFSHSLIPIICIGETEDQRNSGQTDHIIYQQLHDIFEGKELDGKKVLIAYEPRWAIGTGKACDATEANRVHENIRHIMKEFLVDTDELPILYGGSVKADNADSYLIQEQINGLLVGGASTKKEEFLSILNIAINA